MSIILTASEAGTISVMATTADDAAGKTATVTAEAAATDIIADIAADPVIIPSDGTVSSTITTTVVDSVTLTPAAGIDVVWSIVSGQGSFDSPTSTTIEDGTATAILSAESGGKGIIVAQATIADDSEGNSVVVIITSPLE